MALAKLLRFTKLQLRQDRAENNTMRSDLRTRFNTQLYDLWDAVPSSTSRTVLNSNEDNNSSYSNRFLGVLNKLIHINT